MRAPQYLLRKWTMFHLGHTGAHGATIVQHFFGIVALGLGEGCRITASLDFQHFANGDMRALNLGGQHRFLRGQRRQQNMCVRNRRQQPIVTRQPGIGRTQQWNQARPLQVAGRKLAKVVADRAGGHAESPRVCR
jgi:hypothetical protein